jgi:hypothetical protein
MSFPRKWSLMLLTALLAIVEWVAGRAPPLMMYFTL